MPFPQTARAAPAETERDRSAVRLGGTNSVLNTQSLNRSQAARDLVAATVARSRANTRMAAAFRAALERRGLSDMVNLSRVKDAAAALAVTMFNNRATMALAPERRTAPPVRETYSPAPEQPEAETPLYGAAFASEVGGDTQ